MRPFGTIKNIGVCFRSLTIFYTHSGKIEKIAGMTMEASGLSCNIGDICEVTIGDGDQKVLTEVVGITGKKVFLMPYQETDGIGYGCTVVNTGRKMMVNMSDDLVGRTVDALGHPMDGGSPLNTAYHSPLTAHPVILWIGRRLVNPLKWASNVLMVCSPSAKDREWAFLPAAVWERVP